MLVLQQSNSYKSLKPNCFNSLANFDKLSLDFFSTQVWDFVSPSPPSNCSMVHLLDLAPDFLRTFQLLFFISLTCASLIIDAKKKCCWMLTVCYYSSNTITMTIFKVSGLAKFKTDWIQNLRHIIQTIFALIKISDHIHKTSFFRNLWIGPIS